ncbi:hypothetical protein [Taibaiella soli]|nr:hypothetical protein [Taibaiella soli]
MRRLFFVLLLSASGSVFAQTMKEGVSINPDKIGKYQKHLQYLMYNGEKVAVGDSLFTNNEQYFGTIKNITKYVKEDAPFYYAGLYDGKRTFQIDLTEELDNHTLMHYNYKLANDGFDVDQVIDANGVPANALGVAVKNALDKVFNDGNGMMLSEDDDLSRIVYRAIIPMSDKAGSFMPEQRRMRVEIVVTPTNGKYRLSFKDAGFENRTQDHPTWTTFGYNDLQTQTQTGINKKWAQETVDDCKKALSELQLRIENEITQASRR